MPAVETNLNFDDLIQAVKESSRGRWFLQEYENRLRKAETGNILAAITKLENALGGMNAPSADAALVARARAAIAVARKDIAAMDHAQAGLSVEARLFSKLADMAKTALAEAGKAPALVNHGVARSLKLVDELEQDFGLAPASPLGSPLPDLQKVDFFNLDAAVFEAKPAATKVPTATSPAAPPATAPSATKEIARGAKLTIRRVDAAQMAGLAEPAAAQPMSESMSQPKSQPLPQPVKEAAPEPAALATPAEAPSLAVPAERPSRVVIVRKKPEELMQVPMVSAEIESTAA